MTKYLRWVLPSFVRRWLGYDRFERIGTASSRPSPESILDWDLVDFYSADWVAKLNEAKRERAA